MKRVGISFAIATLLATVFSPTVSAEATLEISGNGTDSTNTINVTDNQTCTVSQKANTYVDAVVEASAKTGNNEASSNTNGDVTIMTGNATSNATLTVIGGVNSATDPCCCVPESSAENAAIISGNGDNSTNEINATKNKTSSVRQKAKTRVSALVSAKSKTGKNKSNNNTGPGAVLIDTGVANATSDLTVEGGTNELNP